ncbi:MAG TPA: hypothetical protein VGK89_01685 [Candidatus Eisenbacteria bacterium]|jgi:hypothetical protein
MRIGQRVLWALIPLLLATGCRDESTGPWILGKWYGWITPHNHGTADMRDLALTIRADRVYLAIADTAVQTRNARILASENPDLSRTGLVDFDATVAGQALHFQGYVSECWVCLSGIFGSAANADSAVYDWWADQAPPRLVSQQP